MSLAGADTGQPPAQPPRGLGGAYHWLMEAMGLLAGTIIGAQALLVTYDVASRNLGVGMAPWALEVTEYGLTLATFLAAPWVLYHGAHVRIDVLLRTLPATAGRVLEFIVDSLGLIICLALVYLSFFAADEARDFGSVIVKVLMVPEWWMLVPVVLCFSLLAIEFARRLVRIWRG
jgi:TRAP-type C4-dicarboxylate transport system permease small subunit